MDVRLSKPRNARRPWNETNRIVMAALVITIDGPAASGKSTVARLLTEALDATFLDTGAMYRAVTLAAIRDAVPLDDEEALVAVIARHRFDFEAVRGKMLVRIDGEDVTDGLRDAALTAQVRHVAAAPRAREQLVALQRAFAERCDRVVTEGRDQGTVAFPDADAKFYMTAQPAERARRRAAEMAGGKEGPDVARIQRAIEDRDRSDEKRAVGPLKPADDAMRIDTTDLSVEEVVEEVCRRVEERCPRKR